MRDRATESTPVRASPQPNLGVPRPHPYDAAVTPERFIAKWATSTATEKAGSQEHFIDLCRMLGEKTPNDDPGLRDSYAFEKTTARTTTEGSGFADVWLASSFAWEYKGKHKDLGKAYKQLIDYHEALGHPPLLVVCDMQRFEVHTKWTNTESWVYRFEIKDLATNEPVEVRSPVGVPDGAKQMTALQVLKALFEEPERLRPGRTTDQITKDAAARF